MPRHPAIPEQLTTGPFTLADARGAGLTRWQLRGSSWRRISGGVYVWAGLRESSLLAIAGLRRRLPPGAAFSGRTAAWLHGFDGSPGVPPEVTVPYGCGVSARACMSLRHGTLTDTDVVQLRGFPATSPLRTAFDLSRRLPLVDAVAAVDAALHNRTVELAEFRSYVVEHSRCAGVAQARRVAELADASAESPMETRLRMLLVLAGLPPPQAQVPLYDDRGRFLGRPDLYYPEQRVGLEYDGSTHRDSLVEDNRRQNRLLGAGFRLLRFTAADVYNTPDAVVAQVDAALKRTVSGKGANPPAVRGTLSGKGALSCRS
jgi:hypothetical protein